jgi:hypothetical protein
MRIAAGAGVWYETAFWTPMAMSSPKATACAPDKWQRGEAHPLGRQARHGRGRQDSGDVVPVGYSRWFEAQQHVSSYTTAETTCYTGEKNPEKGDMSAAGHVSREESAHRHGGHVDPRGQFMERRRHLRRHGKTRPPLRTKRVRSRRPRWLLAAMCGGREKTGPADPR